MPHLHAHRFSVQVAALAACTLLLQACGGGGGDASSTPVTPTPPVSTSPSVTALTADRLSYGRVSRFSATGTNLGSGILFAATGCSGLTVESGGSATQQIFSCTPDETLSVRVAASSNGTEFFSQTNVVPKPQVTMTTSMGEVVIELEPATVKLTVDNFLAYVNGNYYNGTIFHRVIPNFVVQGGGFTGVGNSTLVAQTGTGAPIVLESNKGLNNVRGTIAMARTNAFDSATSQFFFNVVDNLTLDYQSAASPGYAVFGRVVSELGVLAAMTGVQTGTVGNFGNVPTTDIVLLTAVQTK